MNGLGCLAIGQVVKCASPDPVFTGHSPVSHAASPCCKWNGSLKLHVAPRNTIEASCHEGKIGLLIVTPASRRTDVTMQIAFNETADTRHATETQQRKHVQVSTD